MPAQLLVNVFSVGPLAGGASITIPHGLNAAGAGLVPTQIIPNYAVNIVVSAVNATTATFTNADASPLSAVFRCEYDHSIHAVDADPLYWQGAQTGGGTGVVLAGDVTGPSAANTVERIRNLLIDPGITPANNEKLGWDSLNGWWESQDAAVGGAYDVSSFITGFPAAGATLMQVQGVRNSRMTRIRLSVDVAPAADAQFILSTGAGSLTFTLPAFNTGVVATASGSGIPWGDGAFLRLLAPAVQDVQMQTVRWTVQGTVQL
jgi:uncharacterized protein YfiM (DUF2279 family)